MLFGPFKAKQMNKKRIFRFNIVIACLFCFLVNCHFLITYSLVYQPSENNNKNLIPNENYVCEYVQWKEFYDYYWIYIDASVYSFVPSFLIITTQIKK